MTLTLYRRHKRTCPNFGKPRRARQVKCSCKFWGDGVLAGREVRVSLDTRDSKKANEKLHEAGQQNENTAEKLEARVGIELLLTLRTRKLLKLEAGRNHKTLKSA